MDDFKNTSEYEVIKYIRDSTLYKYCDLIIDDSLYDIFLEEIKKPEYTKITLLNNENIDIDEGYHLKSMKDENIDIDEGYHLKSMKDENIDIDEGYRLKSIKDENMHLYGGIVFTIKAESFTNSNNNLYTDLLNYEDSDAFREKTKKFFGTINNIEEPVKIYIKKNTPDVKLLFSSNNRWLYYHCQNYTDKYNNSKFEFYTSNTTDIYKEGMSDEDKFQISRFYSGLYCLCYAIEISLMVKMPWFISYKCTVDEFTNELENNVKTLVIPQCEIFKQHMLDLYNNVKKYILLMNDYRCGNFQLDLGNRLAITMREDGNCFTTSMIQFDFSIFDVDHILDYEKKFLMAGIDNISSIDKYEQSHINAIKYKVYTAIELFVTEYFKEITGYRLSDLLCNNQYHLLNYIFSHTIDQNRVKYRICNALWCSPHAGFSIISKQIKPVLVDNNKTPIISQMPQSISPPVLSRMPPISIPIPLPIPRMSSSIINRNNTFGEHDIYGNNEIDENVVKDINEIDKYRTYYSLLCDGNYLSLGNFAILSHNVKLGEDSKYENDGVIRSKLISNNNYYQYETITYNFKQIFSDLNRSDNTTLLKERYDQAGDRDYKIIIKITKNYINKHNSQYKDYLSYIYPIYTIIIKDQGKPDEKQFESLAYVYYKQDNIDEDFFVRREFITLVSNLIWGTWGSFMYTAYSQVFENSFVNDYKHAKIYGAANLYIVFNTNMLFVPGKCVHKTRIMTKIIKDHIDSVREQFDNYTNLFSNRFNKLINYNDNKDKKLFKKYYSYLKECRIETIRAIHELRVINYHIALISDQYKTNEINDLDIRAYTFIDTLKNDLKLIKKDIDELHSYIYDTDFNFDNISNNKINDLYSLNKIQDLESNINNYEYNVALADDIFNEYKTSNDLDDDEREAQLDFLDSQDYTVGETYLKDEEKFLSTDVNDIDWFYKYQDSMNEYLDNWEEEFLFGGFKWNIWLIFLIIFVIIVIIIIVIVIVKKKKIFIN